MKNEKIEYELSKYSENYLLFEKFGKKMEALINDILHEANVVYLTTEMRVKDKESVKRKLLTKKSSLESLNDVVGIRVITYVQSNIGEVLEVLGQTFTAEEIPSENASLGIDRVGYRSSHWKLKLPDERLLLVEYKPFKDLHFELQVRTALAHAWAQNSHNQFYKNDVKLPDKIERDFKLVSGLLEIADNEFNRIAEAIQDYKVKVEAEVSIGKYDLVIDSVTIREFFDARFKSNVISATFGPKDNMAEEIIEELKNFGVKNLSELDTLAKKINLKKLEASILEHKESSNYCGIARDIMLIHDTKKYFEKSWNGHWSSISPQSLKLLTELGLDSKSIDIIKNKVTVQD